MICIFFSCLEGWSLGEHQEWSKFSNFEVSVRVPLLMYVPSLTSKPGPAGTNFPFKDALKNFKTSSLQYSRHKSAENAHLYQRNFHQRNYLRGFRKTNAKHFTWQDNRQNEKKWQMRQMSRGKEDLTTENAHLYRRNFHQRNYFRGFRKTNKHFTSQDSWQDKKKWQMWQVSRGKEDLTIRFERPDSDQNAGLVSNALVELVDLFPTYSELAGLSVPELCPRNSSSIDFCTEGVSLVKLIKESAESKKKNEKLSLHWKSAAFSQYPRPSDYPQHNSDLPKLADIKIMGYSMRTVDYRYTEWVGFNHSLFGPKWDDVHAKELYFYDSSDGLENHNQASNKKYQGLVQKLSEKLHKGWRAALPQHL